MTLNYADPPGGAVGGAVANVLSSPERKLREDLQNFARIAERGDLGGPAAQTPSVWSGSRGGSRGSWSGPAPNNTPKP